MTEPTSLEAGKTALSQQNWPEAFECLTRADEESSLSPDELVLLGDAAYLAGKEAASIAVWTRAHNDFVRRGDTQPAARIGFWLSLTLLLSGKGSQAAGWLSKTQRLLKDREDLCAECGLALVVEGLFCLGKGEVQSALDCFERAVGLAGKFPDADLKAFSVLSQGQALVALQKSGDGVVLLDEAMVEVTTGSVSPIAAGIIYCAVILVCESLFDVNRAHEWTQALDDWCASQSGLVPFRGQCMVHRAEVMRLKGDWPVAMDEAKRAGDWFAQRSSRFAGRALYQQAEVLRLRGQFEQAEKLYREAGARGFEPQPGVSLLRLAEGNLEAAVAAISRVCKEASEQVGPGASATRSTLLGPYVEIMLAAGDIDAARTAAEDLAKLAALRDAPLLGAISAHATGIVLLADARAQEALSSLREAWTLWQQLDAPYESARAQISIAQACEALDDSDTARMHLEAAAQKIARLGAAPGPAGLPSDSTETKEVVADLSDRELEVLALVATGKTNKQIALDLSISEHTVARHISNMFNKLDVSSRTAAGAFAHEHGLV